MALTLTYKDTTFGIGDRIKVHQTVKEHDKSRNQVFEGMVIAIKGNPEVRTFTVRKIGEQNVGIEKVFPIKTPTIAKIEVIKSSVAGTRHAKLYYVRKKSRREIDKINSRSVRRSSK